MRWSCWFYPRSYLGSSHGRTHGTFLPSFSHPLLGQAVVAGKRGFILPLQADAGRTWLSWKSRKRQHQFPWAVAELRARVGLAAIGSFSGHEEAEPACIKTLGVVGTGVGCLAPRDGSQDPVGSVPHAVECPCPPCLCWSRGGNCQCGAALSGNRLKSELCQKYFHPSAEKNNGPRPAGRSGGVATAPARCHPAAQGRRVSSSDTSCSFGIHARAGDPVAEQDVRRGASGCLPAAC